MKKITLPSTLIKIEEHSFYDTVIKKIIVPNKEIKNLVPEEFRDKCIIKNDEQVKLQSLHDEYIKQKENKRDNMPVQARERD